MSEPDNQDKLNNRRKRLGCLPLEVIIKRKAREQNIPEAEVKLKLAIPRPDGRTELTAAEITETLNQIRESSPFDDEFIAEVRKRYKAKIKAKD